VFGVTAAMMASKASSGDSTEGDPRQPTFADEPAAAKRRALSEAA